MDYRAFFEELGRSYAHNGLEFPYTYDGFYYGVLTRNKTVLGPFIAESAYKKAYAVPKEQTSFPKALSHPWCYASSDGKAKAPWYAKSIEEIQKARYFEGPADMVYTLAWELSQRIGRLPDGLHARMVLSADDHRCIRRYVAEWGA